MQRYFLDHENKIDKDDVHHILNVMRFKSGTVVEVCGISGCYLATLEIQHKEVGFSTTEKLDDNPPLNVTIVQGLPKGDKMDTVTKYATLFQAKSIIFVAMKRSIAKLSNVDHKLSRLNKIAKEAAELSKRSTLPQIQLLDNLKDINTDGKQLVLLDELERVYNIKDFIKDHGTKDLIVIIGPEGGIDETERNALVERGAITVSLGQSILPTELAHIPILNACLLTKI